MPGGDDCAAAEAGLYMVLELLSLFCKALNLSFPVSESICSRESSLSSDCEGGVADIFFVFLLQPLCHVRVQRRGQSTTCTDHGCHNYYWQS